LIQAVDRRVEQAEQAPLSTELPAANDAALTDEYGQTSQQTDHYYRRLVWAHTVARRNGAGRSDTAVNARATAIDLLLSRD
jgi:hypothetical protein